LTPGRSLDWLALSLTKDSSPERRDIHSALSHSPGANEKTASHCPAKDSAPCGP
jgi:hypothetical protein